MDFFTITSFVIIILLLVLTTLFSTLFRWERKKNRSLTQYYSLVDNILGIVDNNITLGKIHKVEQNMLDHTSRVGSYSYILAKELKLPPNFCEEIKMYAPMHDIGKLTVPQRLLEKPDKLTPKEFEIVKNHTENGYQLLSNSEGANPTAMSIVRYHHEWFNGDGYPSGLSSQDIPIEARIVAISDVYDTLRMDTSYRKGVSHESAIRILSEGSDIQFDPKLVSLFLENAPAFEKIYKKGKKQAQHAMEKWSKEKKQTKTKISESIHEDLENQL